MGNSAYSEESGEKVTSNYAAKVASSYNYGGYKDWFLPSIDEILAMMEVSDLNVTQETSLWSSWDYYDDDANIAPATGSSGNCTSKAKSTAYAVRPVRRF